MDNDEINVKYNKYNNNKEATARNFKTSPLALGPQLPRICYICKKGNQVRNSTKIVFHYNKKLLT